MILYVRLLNFAIQKFLGTMTSKQCIKISAAYSIQEAKCFSYKCATLNLVTPMTRLSLLRKTEVIIERGYIIYCTYMTSDNQLGMNFMPIIIFLPRLDSRILLMSQIAILIAAIGKWHPQTTAFPVK